MAIITQEERDCIVKRKEFLAEQLAQTKNTFLMFIGEGEYIIQHFIRKKLLAADKAFFVGNKVKIIAGPIMCGDVIRKENGEYKIVNLLFEWYEKSYLELYIRQTRTPMDHYFIRDGECGWLEAHHGPMAPFRQKTIRPMTPTELELRQLFFKKALNFSKPAHLRPPITLTDAGIESFRDWLEKRNGQRQKHQKSLDINQLTIGRLKRLVNQWDEETGNEL